MPAQDHLVKGKSRPGPGQRGGIPLHPCLQRNCRHDCTPQPGKGKVSTLISEEQFPALCVQAEALHRRNIMRGLLLWILGIPLPLIIIIYLLF